MVRLKKIAHPRRKWTLAVLVTAWILFTYMIPNKFPLFPARPVPLLDLDLWIGFSPYWVWPYVSYYVMLVVPYYATDDSDILDQLVHSYVWSALVSGIFFMVFPTMLERGAFTYSGPVDSMTESVLGLLRAIDTSVNCFPSEHITLTTIAALTLIRISSRWLWWVIPWSLAIAYSTVATKQHYVIDIAGGFFFGLVVFWFFTNCVYVERDDSHALANAIGKKN